MDETETALTRFTLFPTQAQRQEILSELNKEMADETVSGNEYLKTLCVLLFSIGHLEDSMVIWEAKNKSFDSFLYIDVQLLVGAGVEQTIEYLRTRMDSNSMKAVNYLSDCIAAGDFTNFSKESYLEDCQAYYGIDKKSG